VKSDTARVGFILRILSSRAPAQCLDVARAFRRVSGEHEIDAARLQVDARDLHSHPVGEAELLARAIADQLVSGGVELKVILPSSEMCTRPST